MRMLRTMLMALALISFQANAGLLDGLGSLLHGDSKKDAAPAQTQSETGRTLVVKSTASGKRVALVIGNGDYQHSDLLPKLANPPHDAEDIAKALRGFGFDVIERKNLTKREIKEAITEFGRKIADSDAALFYYAGHGLQVKGQNYLVPVDADIESEASVDDEGVNVNRVLSEMDYAKSRANIVMLDACRNNPISGKFRSGATRGLAAPGSTPQGTVIVYATDPGNVAADGDGRNGLFTAGLLTAFKGNDLSLSGVLLRASQEVERGSEHKQTPYVNGPETLKASFHFGQGTQVASLEPVPNTNYVPTPVHVKTREEIEDETWSVAESANTEEAINAYLAGNPHGRYVTQAKVKLAALKKQAQESAPVVMPPVQMDAEGSLWTEVQKGNTLDDYNAYLAQYPKGKYAALAKSRGKKLKEEADAQARQEREAAARQAAQEEQSAWDSANSTATEDSYQEYMNTYPRGRFATLAQARISKLKNEAAQAQQKQEAELRRQKAEEARNAGKGPAMVRIPGRNYEMGKYDVTRGEFAKFVKETGYDAGNQCYVWTGSAWDNRSGSNWRNPGFSQDDNHPVTCVNWNDAQAYVSWLSKKTGKQYRLPTEAEWEYACYGGSQTEYCGSNDIDAVAWYNANSGSQTHPVGQKQANGYGLYDMSGNVWQWMGNKYDNEHDWRALRGGSWASSPQDVRAAYRSRIEPAPRNHYYGFRLARTLP